ncbi:unnamed protein product [Rotaria sp. Silwood1]|nr:unnamed protein product [Rotaria sp. Silwood1]CAF4749756.1 unnamed protein product [Rotaria sp. Silwood1]
MIKTETTVMMIGSDSQLSNNDDMEPMIVDIDASNKKLPKKPVQFTLEDLCAHFEPIIYKMIASKDSYPFQQPIDPVALNIPDYSTIIKHPMDISTIHNKLLRGEYKNPLEFCDDVWLMFNNTWLYNRKTTHIYKMCTKLAELFVKSVDPVVQALGYCCSRQYVYLPQVLLCYGKQQYCQIIVNDNYYYYNNSEPSRFNLSNDKYTFCTTCFNSVQSDSIFIGDDPTQTLIEIPKSLFLLAKNDIKELETMIDCIVCTRRWHQVCALHLDQIWPEGFICNTCIHQYNIKRKENRYIASELPVNNLSIQLEKRVNNFLHNHNCQTSHVIIRILSVSDKICKVKPNLKKYYPCQAVNGYPYQTKAIFAFQEIDGVDVIFCGMYVQEYDEHCPAPNTRRVYISYFDTVHFFQPKIYRTDVYHEILIGYLDYVKQHGYMYAHIWACPAHENLDYIFHRHPSEQRMPTLKRIQNWCKKMLNKAIAERIVISYKDIMQDCLDNQVQTILDIPYFDGDFWPYMIENYIEQIEKEEYEELDNPFESENSTNISSKRKSASTDENKRLKKTADRMSNSSYLLSTIFSAMEKYKETFFVIRLHNEITSYPTFHDINAVIQCDIMNTRNIFLSFVCQKNYEFSSLRRAKFSTISLLYELHTSTTDIFTYYCNACRQQCDIYYHCTVCEDFDFCEKCYNMDPKHEHKMKRSMSSIVRESQYGKHNSLNVDDKSITSILCKITKMKINATLY